MKRTDEFAKDLCRELNRHRNSGVQWKCGGPVGIRAGHEAVDATAYRKNQKPVALVEVELRRDAPLSNVAKVWHWAREGSLPRNVVLIQAFSANYGKEDKRRRNAEFIGEQMEHARVAKYIPIHFGYRPRKYGKVGAGRRHYHATLLARRIAKLIG